MVNVLFKEGNNDIDPCVGIVDTGAPKTVAGRLWIQSYLSSTGIDALKIISQKQKFRFGNGPIYVSNICYKINGNIGKLNTSINVSVVDANVPLLIGLDYQKKWGIVIDVQEGTLKIKATNETFKVNKKRNNRWKLKLQNKTLLEEATNLVLNVHIDDIKNDKLKKNITKIHKNLGHKSENQLRLLFKMAEKDDTDINNMIHEVSEDCNVCLRFNFFI